MGETSHSKHSCHTCLGPNMRMRQAPGQRLPLYSGPLHSAWKQWCVQCRPPPSSSLFMPTPYRRLGHSCPHTLLPQAVAVRHGLLLCAWPLRKPDPRGTTTYVVALSLSLSLYVSLSLSSFHFLFLCLFLFLFLFLSLSLFLFLSLSLPLSLPAYLSLPLSLSLSLSLSVLSIDRK